MTVIHEAMILTTPFHIDGLTASAYHAAPGISSTMIRLLPENPLKFRNQYMCRRPGCMKLLEDCQCPEGPICDPHKVTPQMQLGTDVHRVLLDRAAILVIPPELLTKTGLRPTGEKTKLPLEAWEAEHRDTVNVLTEDSPVHRMVESAYKRSKRDGWFVHNEGYVRERSIWWVDEATGLLQKARIDLWKDESRVLDIKTSKAPRPGPRDFQREIADYELHRQLTHYTAGCLSVGMVARKSGIIAIGNSPEYECWYHPMSAEAMRLGWEQNIKARAELVDRLESGDWYPKGYGEATETGPSQWYMDRYGE